MEILFLLIGLVLGFILATLICRPKTIGTLKIVKMEDETPYLFLDLDEEIDKFYSNQYVHMKVSHK